LKTFNPVFKIYENKILGYTIVFLFVWILFMHKLFKIVITAQLLSSKMMKLFRINTMLQLGTSKMMGQLRITTIQLLANWVCKRSSKRMGCPGVFLFWFWI